MQLNEIASRINGSVLIKLKLSRSLSCGCINPFRCYLPVSLIYAAYV